MGWGYWTLSSTRIDKNKKKIKKIQKYFASLKNSCIFAIEKLRLVHRQKGLNLQEDIRLGVLGDCTQRGRGKTVLEIMRSINTNNI